LTRESLKTNSKIPSLEKGRKFRIRITLKDYIDIYLRELATRQFSARTLSNYSDILYPLNTYLKEQGSGLEDMTNSQAGCYTVHLLDKGLNPISINQYVITIKAFYDWAIDNKYYGGRNPFQEIKKRPTKDLLPVFCIEEEIRRLYKLIEVDNKIKVQEVTMFDCFFSTGIRTSELCNLRTTDIIQDEGKVFFKIRGGKGDKDREVIVQPFGWEAVQKHLAGLKLRGFSDDLIFPNGHGKKMLRQDVYKSIRKILIKVKDRKFGAHTLRHTFATYLMNHGTPLKGIQVQLGHASLETTQKYTHLDIKRMKAVHKNAHPRG
jgi:site-specific recombinase XerD